MVITPENLPNNKVVSFQEEVGDSREKDSTDAKQST